MSGAERVDLLRQTMSEGLGHMNLAKRRVWNERDRVRALQDKLVLANVALEAAERDYTESLRVFSETWDYFKGELNHLYETPPASLAALAEQVTEQSVGGAFVSVDRERREQLRATATMCERHVSVPKDTVIALLDAADRADRLAAALSEAVVALHLTREYVGPETLPELPGWSWFNATENAAAVLAEHGDATP